MEDEIRQFVVGPLSTNCYVYISQGEAMVVDPGGSGAQVAKACSDVQIKYIVATHGHSDHTAGILGLKRETRASYLIAKEDEAMAMEARRKGVFGADFDDDAPRADEYLQEGDEISFGSASFSVLSCPGHTPGGICLLGQKSAAGVCFVGDSLFKGSAGRCDLPGGNFHQLQESLLSLKTKIPEDTKIYPGHGPSTTMREEISTNPYLI